MTRFFKGLLLFGYAFLYIPIASLIFYSFNSSRHVTIWESFSLKWYSALFSNERILSSAWISLKIAVFSATLAVVFGTLAAISFSLFKKFRGKKVIQSFIAAPLIIPEVILGLSFFLLFIAAESYIGWPSRGISTVTLAHATVSMAYVTSIVKTQLNSFDANLIEAAQDLGAPPFKAYAKIVLPIIFPSLAVGWLLSFVLSLDDLVIATFVTGPESTTLPMVIFSSIRFGLTPEVNALSTLIIGVLFLSFVFVGIHLKRNLHMTNRP